MAISSDQKDRDEVDCVKVSRVHGSASGAQKETPKRRTLIRRTSGYNMGKNTLIIQQNAMERRGPERPA